MRHNIASLRLTFCLVAIFGLQICACTAIFAADLPLIKPNCPLNHIEPGCPWPRTQLHQNITVSGYKRFTKKVLRKQANSEQLFAGTQRMQTINSLSEFSPILHFNSLGPAGPN